ncbi:MAG TPA: trigger factor [Erysipelotrichaceae bacterium]|nr:trigger factor [Erysipelotrichaceae bacterium]
MKTTWTMIEKTKGELKVDIEGDVWQNAQKKAFNKLAKDVQLPGFRKGKAPLDLVKKQIAEQNILVEAVEAIAQEALDLGLEEHKLNPITRPELGMDAISTEKVSVKFTFEVLGEIKLGEYKNLGITKEVAIVTPEEVDAKLEGLRAQFAELVLKEEGTVELKDTAVIDFEGFKDGVAFEGGKGENHALEIGSNTFIPGFEEALIGMKSGEEKDVTLTFPENYQAEHLAGQEVVFKVKVNEIKSKQLPALNDDFVKEADQKDIETLDALKAKFEKDILADKAKKAEDDYNNALLTRVVEGSELEVPHVLIDDETNTMLEDFANRLQQQGFSLKQYTELTGQTEDDLRTQMHIDAEGKVKVRLVLDAVAKAENITVTHEEIDNEYKTIAETYQMDLERVKQLAPEGTIAYDLRLRKAYDIIRESNQ